MHEILPDKEALQEFQQAEDTRERKLGKLFSPYMYYTSYWSDMNHNILSCPYIELANV